jgi:hypothetical protein
MTRLDGDEMNCPTCNSVLRIGKTKITFKHDDTPDIPTEAYNNLPMLCTNTDCKNYAGTDLNEPKHIVQTVMNRM